MQQQYKSWYAAWESWTAAAAVGGAYVPEALDALTVYPEPHVTALAQALTDATRIADARCGEHELLPARARLEYDGGRWALTWTSCAGTIVQLEPYRNRWILTITVRDDAGDVSVPDEYYRCVADTPDDDAWWGCAGPGRRARNEETQYGDERTHSSTRPGR